MSSRCVFVDATPTQGGLVSFPESTVLAWKYGDSILHTEFVAAWLATIIYPNRVVMTDNQAVLHLLSKGKLPPGLRRWPLQKLMMSTYRVPKLHYWDTTTNPADCVSRI